MKISQFNLQYNSLQDRILMRINTADQELMEFWLTRRYLIALWDVLLQLLDRDQDVARQKDPLQKQSITSFKRQQTLSQVDTQRKFDDATIVAWPLGKEPLLLCKIQVRNKGDNAVQAIWFGDTSDRGLEIPISASLPHLLIHLVTQSHQASGWEIAAINEYNQREQRESPQMSVN
jgi:hypothetical protein